MRDGSRSYLMTRTEMMLSCYDYSKVIIQLYSVLHSIIAHALHLRNVRSAKEVWNNNALITHNAVVMTPSQGQVALISILNLEITSISLQQVVHSHKNSRPHQRARHVENYRNIFASLFRFFLIRHFIMIEGTLMI